MDNYTQKAAIKAKEHRRLLEELKELAVSIDRCQDTIASLVTELTSANAKFQGERTTQQEVDYLTILLACARQKLVWEKQMASVQKRAPALLAEISEALNDKDFPPSDELKIVMMQSLQSIQSALERLQASSEGTK